MDYFDLSKNILTIIVAIITLIVAFLTYLARGRIKFGKLDIKFDQNLMSETKQFQDELESNGSIIDEDPKFKLLKQYHSQGLAQSKISFWFSLIFASIGFAIIVIGILSIDKETSLLSQGRAFITLLSGTIIDAVSALFFVQSNKARQLMSEFFDKLRIDRKFEESLKLSNEIPDEKLKGRLKTYLAINFADSKVDVAILEKIFDLRNLDDPNKQ